MATSTEKQYGTVREALGNETEGDRGACCSSSVSVKRMVDYSLVIVVSYMTLYGSAHDTLVYVQHSPHHWQQGFFLHSVLTPEKKVTFMSFGGDIKTSVPGDLV